MDEVQTNIDGFQAFLNQVEALWIEVSGWVGQLFGADEMTGGIIITIVALLLVVGGAVVSFINHVGGN